MASAVRGVWAIDIGSNALKALRMHEGANGIEVLDFAYLEHSKNLSSGEVRGEEKQQILTETIQKFLDENEIGQDEVAISIAGQNSFARFIKLPPVEPKKIPEIVQFEAVQQIPFDINEVEWDWQLMETEGSPDKEVGLFAIKNEVISEVMDHFTRSNLRVTCVQIAPMALYNYAYYDIKEVAEGGRKATVILDMGAENTTLVICTKDGVWQRSIRIGGNTFTQAIADAFHKGFETAEKLKRTAPMSKYMRQIYTAMKPVYTDLGGEIQRSLGFYSSSPQGRDKQLTKIIAVGGGMKLQGLAKYLTQTLGMQVIKPDSFERLTMASDLSVARFHENVSDFGVAYGLGAQLLGEARIRTNLLPRKIARAMAWTRKARMFTLAAAVLFVVMLLGVAKAFRDKSVHAGHQTERSQIQAALSQVSEIKNAVDEQEAKKQPAIDKITKERERFKYREVVPQFTETIVRCLPNKENNPSQADLLDAFERGDVQAVMSVPRGERRQLFVTAFAVEYANDLETAAFPKLKVDRGFSYEGGMRGMRTAAPSRMPGDFMEGGLPMGGGMMADGGMAPAAPQKSSGFTIVIEGYSPYGNIAELLDPSRAGDDQSRWGVVTRFVNMNSLFPGAAFELYKKADIKHFKVETGLVDLKDTNMPAGIGLQKKVERVPAAIVQQNASRRENMMMGDMYEGGFTGERGATGPEFITEEDVLFDPMTGEEISKVYDIITQKDLDANPALTTKDLGRRKTSSFGEVQYITRDYWFRIQAKFVWKEAPQDPMESLMGADPTMMGS